ncbi:MAG: polyhydroxyalkanoic acid system family protein [Gammaproteobacteria bacterium]|nr:polyhydroxyalkanoic acid system family protein [Gammaproteobacteria bacterium]
MRIRRSHNLGTEEARKRADRIADDLKEQFSVTPRWQGDVLHVKGSGVTGRLHVDDTHFELKVSLSFALKLMEGPIRSVIEKTIDEELA